MAADKIGRMIFLTKEQAFIAAWGPEMLEMLQTIARMESGALGEFKLLPKQVLRMKSLLAKIKKFL